MAGSRTRRFGALSESGGLKDFATATRTAGNVSLVQTTFTVLDTALDLSATAAAGDLIELGVSAVFLAGAAGGEGHLRPVTVDPTAGDAVINSFASGTDGVPGWSSLTDVEFGPIGGSVWYVLLAGDIKSGAVKVRLQGKKTAAAARTIAANSAVPLSVYLLNHGTPQNQ